MKDLKQLLETFIIKHKTNGNYINTLNKSLPLFDNKLDIKLYNKSKYDNNMNDIKLKNNIKKDNIIDLFKIN